MNEIVLFIPSDNAASSGAFLCMFEMCKLLRDDYGYEPIVVLRTDGTGTDLLDRSNIKYIFRKSYNWVIDNRQHSLKERFKFLVLRCLNLFQAIRLSFFIKKEGIQLVHLNTSWIYYGLIAAKLARVPCVWHIREKLEEGQGKKTWVNHRERVFNKADAIIAVSNYIYNCYAKSINSGKMLMIYDGIDSGIFYQEKSAHPNKDITEFLCVGGLLPYKNQKTVIEATEILRNRGVKNFRVSFVGSGNVSEYEEFARKHNAENNVSFLGPCANVEKLYKNTDVLISASDAEAFGRTVVEAMMSECAVIGSNTGATTELLCNGKYGWLFRVKDAEDLADKMQFAINHPEERRRIALTGQKYALNNYTLKRNAENINKVYRELL